MQVFSDTGPQSEESAETLHSQSMNDQILSTPVKQSYQITTRSSNKIIGELDNSNNFSNQSKKRKRLRKSSDSMSDSLANAADAVISKQTRIKQNTEFHHLIQLGSFLISSARYEYYFFHF